MCREPRRSARAEARRSGFALIAALALLVVLGATGATMLRMTSFQQAGATRAILAVRGTHAARSGLEWARHRARSLRDCPAPTSTLSLSEGALTGFRVVVTCAASRHREGSDERSTLQLEARATFGVVGGRDFVYRELRETLTL